MKVNVVFWTGSGNTEAMANAIAEGAESAGAQVEVMPVSEANGSVAQADVLVLGCPAMGAENLEETEFEPFYQSIRDGLKGKKVALFGSYGWGDGEWMRTWQEDAESAGAILVADGLMVNGAPDEDGLRLCKELGVKAAQ